MISVPYNKPVPVYASAVRKVSGQLLAPAALSPENGPRNPLSRWLGGLQSRSGGCGEWKIRRCRESNHVSSVVPPLVTTLAELSRHLSMCYSKHVH